MRAYDHSLRFTKNEPDVTGEEVISLNTALPDGRYRSRHSGGGASSSHHRGNSNRGGGNRRGGYMGRGGRGYQPADDRSDLRYKLVKLGDYPEKLIGAVKDVARFCDAFLGPDLRRWELPAMSIGEDEEMKLTDLKGAELLSKTLFSNVCLLAESDSAYLVDVMSECVACLPHKHSFYATLWWLILFEATREVDDLNGLIYTSYLGSTKAELVAVKGEMVEAVEEGVTTIEGGNVCLPPTSPQMQQSAEHLVKVARTKLEGGGDPSFSSASGGQQNYSSYANTKEALHYLYLFQALLDKLKLELEEVSRSEAGLHKMHRALNILHFLADLVNLTLIDPVIYLECCVKLLSAAQEMLSQVVKESEGIEGDDKKPPASKQLVRLAEWYAVWGVEAVMWLSKDVYLAHQDLFALIREKIAAISGLRESRSRSELEAINWLRLEGDFFDGMKDGFEALLCRKWISKVIPRLYESPKLQEHHQKPLYLRLPFQFSLQIDPQFWTYFAADYAAYLRHQEALNPTPVQRYVQPPPMLKWQSPLRIPLQVKIFTQDDYAKFLYIETLNPADSIATRIYIDRTLMAFFTNPDLCAERLLSLPIEHDQFPYLLVEQIIATLLAPPHTPTASPARPRLASLLVTQLLHRLCTLERTISAIVTHAYRRLLSTIDSWDECFFSQMVEFSASWMIYQDLYAQEFMKALMEQSEMVAFLNRIKVAAPKSEGHLEDLKFDGSAVATIIATPLATLSVFENSLLRYASHLVSRVQAITFQDTFDRKVPEVLCKLLPRMTPLDFDTDSSFVRSVQDVEVMSELKIHQKPPLEAILLHYLLRLQVTGSHEVDIIIEEALAFLRQCVGKGFIADISGYNRDTIDRLIFPSPPKSLKRDLKQVKNLEDEEEEEEGDLQPVKRPRAADQEDQAQDKFGSSTMPFVKTELITADEENNSQEASAEAMVPIKGEIEEPDDTSQPLPESTSTPDKVAHLPFTYLHHPNFIWDHQNLTQMLVNVLVFIGHKTLSHSQKALDLYKPLIQKWLQYIQEEAPSMDETLHHNQTDQIIIKTLIETWLRTSITRFKFSLQQFMVCGLIKPASVIAALFEHVSSVPLILSVAGDYIFGDLMESCLGVIGRPLNVKENSMVKENRDDFGPELDASAKNEGFSEHYEMAIMQLAQVSEQLSLQADDRLSFCLHVCLRRIARLLKEFCLTNDKVDQMISKVNTMYPKLAASSQWLTALQQATIYSDCFRL